MLLLRLSVLSVLFGCVTTETPTALSAPISFNLPNYTDDSNLLRSDSLIGQKMVIEFYFNGCPSCNSNAQNFRSMWGQHGRHAQFLEVSIDCDQSDYEDWTASHDPEWPVLMDCDRVLAEGPLNVQSYPTTVVVDRNHNVIYRTSGVWNTAKKRAISAAIME